MGRKSLGAPPRQRAAPDGALGGEQGVRSAVHTELSGETAEQGRARGQGHGSGCHKPGQAEGAPVQTQLTTSQH